MEYRSLGASGLKVSAIALGNWVTHGGQIGDDAARRCVQAAIEAGINYFDTADIYERGKAETVLGEILKGRRREHLVIASKCFWPMSYDPNDRGLSRKHMLESCDASLRRLQTDYLDLYQAHRFDPEVPLEETMMAFDHLVRQGKILYVGISEWTAEQIEAGLEIADDLGLHRIVSSQPQYSMLWRVPEAKVMPLCMEEGIAQVCWSPLAMGVLTGKYEPGKPPPEESRASYRQGIETRYLSDEILTAVQNLKPIAADVGLSMATLALAWVLQNDNVASAIIGATRPEQVTENVAASGVELEPEVMKRIDEVLADVIVTDPELTG